MNDRSPCRDICRLYNLIAALAGVFFTLLTAAAVILLPAPYRYFAAATGVLLCAAAETVIRLMMEKRLNGEKEISEEPDFGKLISDVIRKLDQPVSLATVDGKIVWANESLLRLCGKRKTSDLAGKSIEEITGRSMPDLIKADGSEGFLTIGQSCFRPSSYLMQYSDRDCWLTLFDDKTDLSDTLKTVERETAVIGYAVLDNLAELAQYVKVSSREATGATEKVLREWITGLDGYMIEYSRDSYLFAFPKVRLDECVDSGFDILGKVRSIGLGDSSMAVTVSIGLSVCGSDLKERDKDAKTALETALQRGGDQVILRTPGGSFHFGGRTKTEFTRTKIQSRVTAAALIPLLGSAGNVLIMGHKNPDFDCVGSCVGLYRLARAYNGNIKIVTDLQNRNFRTCTEALIEEQPEYADIFVSATAGQDLIRSDTLLIIADVNNLKIVESPEIVANTEKYVIIDHHRKTEDFEREPVFAYIEPGTSSCCELVTEMLETVSTGSGPSDDQSRLTKHEATVMLAGIMLDTGNFTRSTNSETFSAAVYLRDAGGSSETARTFFYNDFSGFVAETKLESSVRLYRGRVAITVSDMETPGAFSGDDRVALAKAANQLLTVRGVDAAFALLVGDGQVLISARSNGKINVQLIMEKLGGGGHFDAAGAQTSGMTVREVIQKLKHAIDLTLDGES
jgi:c-di-AMP phosphodiesterase-like protein